MKAVRGLQHAIEVVDLDEPPGLADGELIDVASASICSSDLFYLTFGFGKILGHEVAGTRADGTAAIVEAMYGCGSCEQCRAGRYNLCPTHTQRALGVTADGGMAEQFRVPSERLVPLPPGLAARDASLVEPAAVAWHALNLANTSAQTRVAIVGAGALGLLAAAGARRMGAPDVAIDARHAHQQAAAERLGARVGASGAYDVVVEAAGSAVALDRAAELVAPGGTVVVLGVHIGTVALNWMPLFHHEASVIPSLGYCRHDGTREMDEAAALLAADADIAATLITHRFPLEDAAEAFRVAGDKTTGAIRVVLEPS